MKIIEGEVQEESWNKKRIILTVAVCLLLIAGIVGFRTEVQKQPILPPFLIQSSKVQGVSTQANQPDDSDSSKALSSEKVKGTLQSQVESIKKQVMGLKVEEIASSSPQIQKVLKDLQGIEKLPAQQAKQVCQQICSRIQ